MQQTSHRISLNPLLLLVIVFVFTLSSCDAEKSASKQSQRPMIPPPRVAVESVHSQNIPIEVNYAARTEAINTVEVGATASGFILNRFYVEGQFVEQRMVLFKINPEKFDAKALQRKAELLEQQAILQKAKRDWERVFKLRKEGAVSQDQRDDAVSALEIAEANVAIAQAKLYDAELDVGYTNVKAPISGIAGLENYSVGNIIVGGTSLTTITQLDPIDVKFSVPEIEFTQLLKPYLLEQTSESTTVAQNLQVEMILADNSHYGAKGRIDFYEKNVNAATDSVQFRAVFPNAERQLLPGQFVRVVISGLEIKAGFILPAQAVIQGKTGAIVYTLNDDNLAQSTPVTVSSQTMSAQATQKLRSTIIITQGLKEGDRVVVDGTIKVIPGQAVEVIDAGNEKSDNQTSQSSQNNQASQKNEKTL